MLNLYIVVQVTGTSLGSLTSVSFSLSGGNLTQSDFSHTLKMHPIENKPFSQLTAVLHASCPARLDLQPLLHPTLYEGAAEGTRQFASALLGEIELNSGLCAISTQHLPRAVLPGLPHPPTCKSGSRLLGPLLPFQALETYCRTTDGVRALSSLIVFKFKLLSNPEILEWPSPRVCWRQGTLTLSSLVEPLSPLGDLLPLDAWVRVPLTPVLLSPARCQLRLIG